MVHPELRQIHELLTVFLGESKNGYEDNVEQYQFPCPCCIDKYGPGEKRKFNLEVNIGGKQAFHCWKCSSEGESMQGSIQKLIRMYGNQQLVRDYRRNIKSLRDSDLYKLDFTPRDFSIDTQNVLEPELSLPPSFKFLNPNEIPPKKVMSYLTSRGIGWDVITKHKIGYTDFQEEDKKSSFRIILPSYDAFGELNYWTGRDYLNFPGRMRYDNAKTEKKNIIFNESLLQWDADITLVEGPFDHIVVPNSIPLLGKALGTDYKLYWELTTRANANVNIWLDSDAPESAKKVYSLLNHGRLHGKVRMIDSGSSKDPSEIYQEDGPKGIVQLLRSAKELPEISLIF